MKIDLTDLQNSLTLLAAAGVEHRLSKFLPILKLVYQCDPALVNFTDLKLALNLPVDQKRVMEQVEMNVNVPNTDIITMFSDALRSGHIHFPLIKRIDRDHILNETHAALNTGGEVYYGQKKLWLRRYDAPQNAAEAATESGRQSDGRYLKNGQIEDLIALTGCPGYIRALAKNQPAVLIAPGTKFIRNETQYCGSLYVECVDDQLTSVMLKQIEYNLIVPKSNDHTIIWLFWLFAEQQTDIKPTD